MTNHKNISEYDGAFNCHDCGASWGALPGNPVEPELCKRKNNIPNYFWIGTSLMRTREDKMSSEVVLLLDETFPHKEDVKIQIVKSLNVKKGLRMKNDLIEKIANGWDYKAGELIQALNINGLEEPNRFADAVTAMTGSVNYSLKLIPEDYRVFTIRQTTAELITDGNDALFWECRLAKYGDIPEKMIMHKDLGTAILLAVLQLPDVPKQTEKEKP
jgi:hypothetical protein